MVGERQADEVEPRPQPMASLPVSPAAGLGPHPPHPPPRPPSLTPRPSPNLSPQRSYCPPHRPASIQATVPSVPIWKPMAGPTLQGLPLGRPPHCPGPQSSYLPSGNTQRIPQGRAGPKGDDVVTALGHGAGLQKARGSCPTGFISAGATAPERDGSLFLSHTRLWGARSQLGGSARRSGEPLPQPTALNLPAAPARGGTCRILPFFPPLCCAPQPCAGPPWASLGLGCLVCKDRMTVPVPSGEGPFSQGLGVGLKAVRLLPLVPLLPS